ncbi:insulin-related peptide 2 [Manduca sexta]|uniref:Insulin-like domain-containing protein n=1 Tax=Manduca sexta TaxID=7130 RepID=A0A921YR09_MANSE|nr:insulin-related peptide 2 [Manduca sexta]XP_030041354.1 insulin-related peptide 2 [Manduca sexta]XP_037296580.1 insulin-related peptide 2 [Manduca sexta]KAG6444210.1 hypothetical protein O3G_MSEX003257 [Manduca sexta]KAG6444211.1 hypothetical protein O3G_MSEX003257 [Manduca sexta]KAG6444212.1 hypothetical protein O3G_MSEX003257 [Manduca sexta]
MKVVLLLCVVAVICVAGQTKLNLCGRPLSEARALLCFGAQTVNKRDSNSLSLSDGEDKIVEDDWPWDGRRAALSASWSRSKRQGIVNECCYKSCEISEILTYC